MLKYYKCNKVLAKVHVKFCNNCWSHHNKALHNKEIQRKRIIKWFENENYNTLRSDCLQAKAFAMNRLIIIDRSSIKSSCKWIYSV